MSSLFDEGITLAGFELLTKLSSGGMGDVLLARRLGAHGFEKLLAIKTIRGELARRPDIRAMFLDEARLVARLDHPNIAQVYDFGEQDGTLFLAMEYVPGVALNKLLAKRGGPLPPGVAMRVVAEVCRGLHAAHELSDIDGTSLEVVHRDVSPGNLILTFDGRMKILDFGIAIMNGRESPDTVVGELKGKPSYMAPEHLRAERVDRRADIYSASVVLHELLTGRKLFTRETVVATVMAVENAKVPRPSEIAGRLPEGLDEIVLRGLEKRADDRYPDARTLAAALDKLVADVAGETLESFVDRELAAERDQHKAWLLGVLHAHASGADDPSRTPTGRRAVPLLDVVPTPRGASGRSSVVPAHAPNDLPATAPQPRTSSLAPRAYPFVDARATELQVDPTSPKTPVFARRSRGAFSWVALAALSFLGAFVGYKLAFEDSVVVVPAKQPLAGVGGVDRPPPRTATAAVAALPVRTATATAELEHPKAVHTAKAKPKEKAPEPRKPVETAAAPHHGEPAAAAPSAFGFVTIGAQPYALVRIDGQEVGATPIMRKKLPTGTHEIQLVSPDNGAVRLRRTVTLAEGEHQRITQP